MGKIGQFETTAANNKAKIVYIFSVSGNVSCQCGKHAMRNNWWRTCNSKTISRALDTLQNLQWDIFPNRSVECSLVICCYVWNTNMYVHALLKCLNHLLQLNVWAIEGQILTVKCLWWIANWNISIIDELYNYSFNDHLSSTLPHRFHTGTSYLSDMNEQILCWILLVTDCRLSKLWLILPPRH